MKVYQTYDRITGEPTGDHYPGIVVEHKAARDRFALFGVEARPLDEAIKVDRMALKRGVGNMFSAYIECDEPSCGCYGAKWYVLYCEGQMVMGPNYAEHVNKIIDETIEEWDLYEVPLKGGQLDVTRVDFSKLF